VNAAASPRPSGTGILSCDPRLNLWVNIGSAAKMSKHQTGAEAPAYFLSAAPRRWRAFEAVNDNRSSKNARAVFGLASSAKS